MLVKSSLTVIGLPQFARAKASDALAQFYRPGGGPGNRRAASVA